MRFKLLAGQHEQADKNKPILDVEGKPTGRYERQKFNIGDVVEHDSDLAARFGEQHFQRLDDPSEDRKKIAALEAEVARLKARMASTKSPGDPTDENLVGSPSVTAGGSVTTGYKATVGEGKGGAMPADMAREQLDKTREEAGQSPTQSGQASHSQANRGEQAQPASLKGQPPPRSEKEYHAQLDQMTVQELKEHAEDREMDLKGATRKDDILKAIKGHRG